MKRKLINKLVEWKENFHKKPILISGARGVGKTYLAIDYAKAYYGEYIYLNLEREPYWSDLFSDNDSLYAVKYIKEYYHLSDYEEPILLILDEVTASKNLQSVMKFVSESKLSFYIMMISSTLKGISTFGDYYLPLELYPLDFEEFLLATGNEWYIEVIRSHYEANRALPDIVHKELLTYLEDYLQIGGMPAAVNEFTGTDTKYNISEQHRILIDSYLTDAKQHNSESDALKINQIFQVMDKQLIKENRKFQYNLIRKGATQTMYAEALEYIRDTFYGIYCCKLEEEYFKQTPEQLKSLFQTPEVNSNFKLYLPDTGILNSILYTQYSDLTDQMKKGRLENYVVQSLKANGYTFSFWESSSQAKIEIILLQEDYVLPVEIRINDMTRSKNISVFRNQYNRVKDSIKISTRNFDYSNNVKYVPLYAVFCI